MGHCLQNIFKKQAIHEASSQQKNNSHSPSKQPINNASGKKVLLLNKSNPNKSMPLKLLYHTKNDDQFTYFLEMYKQNIVINQIIEDLKEKQDKEEKNNVEKYKLSSNHRENLKESLNLLAKYLEEISDKSCRLYRKIEEDNQKIKEKQILYEKNPSSYNFFMIKLQIQDIRLYMINKHQNKEEIIVQKITSLANNQGNDKYYETIAIERIKKEHFYTEIYYTNDKNSKQGVNNSIKISTKNIASSITIDFEQLIRYESICQLLTFRNGNEQIGQITLRMQYVSLSREYVLTKIEKLKLKEKSLRMSLNSSENQVDKFISDRHSERDYSLRQSIFSENMSAYNNEYIV